MIDHPARARVAEIVVTRAGRNQTRGSGYLVAPGWVLTACHVVQDADSVGVWLGAPAELAPEAGAGVHPGQALVIPAADLALLPVGGRAGDPLCEPALFGRLDRDPGPPVPVAAAGCPRFKLRPAPGRPGVQLRELDYAMGSIAPLSDAKTGMYEFAVTAPPGPDPEPLAHSPWEGMSGAAVWASGRLIGVVGQHHPREGLGTLTVRPVDQLFGCATAAGLDAWRAALPPLPATAEGLWLATPPTIREIGVRRALQAAEALAPPVLIGRSAELAALEAFTCSGERWRWIQGEAFAGKTALLAWFTLHPPESVDMAACFLRRASSANTADYALGMLNRQLAGLAGQPGYLPPSSVADRTGDFGDLLHDAARACAERGRRLLVLIDGLDEYDTTADSPDLAGWMPDASSLPDRAMLLVASRAGVDVRLPAAHPLSGCVQHLTASDAATEIQAAARAELDRALRSPGGLVFPLACCLAVADGGMTASELCALLKLHGRDADVSETAALLDSSLGRSLMLLTDPDSADAQVQEYVFAHESLLAEARARLAADLATYQDLLDAWAGQYARRGWPTDTPRYLLRRYTRELAQRARDPATSDSRCRAAIDQLFDVAASRTRFLRVFEWTGNPAAPGRDIAEAQKAIADTRERSGLDQDEVIYRLAVLARRRRPLDENAAPVAATVAEVWAHIGRVSASLELAAGIDDLEWRAGAFNGVAAVLAGAGQARRSADAAGQALQAATGIDNPAQRAKALSEVALVLAGAGQAADAARLALQAAAGIDDPAQRAKALSEVAPALAKTGQAGQAADATGQALEAATSIDGAEQRAWALSDVAVGLARAGRAGQALQAAAGIDDLVRRAMALSRVARALASAGQAGQALEAATSIDDPPGRAWALGGVALALANAGQAGQAADVAGQALEAAAGIDDPPGRAWALSEVALALANAGQAEQAADVAGQALQAADGIGEPESRAMVLSRVAWALAEAGQAGQAADAAGQALQAATGSGEPEQRAMALSGVAWALAEAGQATQALQAATSIGNPARRAGALSEVALGLARAGQARQAADAAGQALQAATGIDDRQWERSERLSWVVWVLARAGMTDEANHVAGQAVTLASAIDNPVQRAGVLTEVARTLAYAGHTGQALQAATGIDAPGKRASALCGVARALADPGQAADAATQALAAARDIDDPGPRAKAMSEAAQTLARAGQPGPALQAAAEIGAPGERASVLSTVAQAMAEDGQAEPAADAAGQALQAATSIDDPEQQAGPLSEAASALAHTRQPVQALHTAARIGHPAVRARTLANVAQALAKNGQAKQAADAAVQAVQAADAVQGVQAATVLADPRALVLSETAQMLAEAGQPGPALQAAAGIDDPDRRARTLSTVSRALNGNAQAADAAGLALQAATAIDDPGSQARALSEVAGALTESGQAGQAAEAAGQALEATDGIDDPVQRVRALTAVTETLARAGLAPQTADAVRRLLQAAAGITAPRSRAQELTETAAMLSRAGKTKSAADAAGQALQTASAVSDPEQRARVLANLVPAERVGRLSLLPASAESHRPRHIVSSAVEAVGRQALEELLLTPNALDYLSRFPAELLQRLIADGELEATERQ